MIEQHYNGKLSANDSCVETEVHEGKGGEAEPISNNSAGQRLKDILSSRLFNWIRLLPQNQWGEASLLERETKKRANIVAETLSELKACGLGEDLADFASGEWDLPDDNEAFKSLMSAEGLDKEDLAFELTTGKPLTMSEWEKLKKILDILKKVYLEESTRENDVDTPGGGDIPKDANIETCRNYRKQLLPCTRKGKVLEGGSSKPTCSSIPVKQKARDTEVQRQDWGHGDVLFCETGNSSRRPHSDTRCSPFSLSDLESDLPADCIADMSSDSRLELNEATAVGHMAWVGRASDTPALSLNGDTQPNCVPNTYKDRDGTLLKKRSRKYETDSGIRASSDDSSHDGIVFHNINSNVPNTSGEGEEDSLVVPSLSATKLCQKWKCRSAPDLRHRDERIEPLRRVSQHDVSFSHRCDVEGRYVITIDSNEENQPSLLWGEEAYRHYNILTMIEAKERLHQLRKAKTNVIRNYLHKQRELQRLVELAKDYYADPTYEKRRLWKEAKSVIMTSTDASLTDLRHCIGMLPEFKPIFTYFLMFSQILVLTTMLAVNGFAPAGMLSETVVGQNIPTFLGLETFHKYSIPNPWLGPHIRHYLPAGATFGLCMRHNRNTKARIDEYFVYDNSTYGCCYVRPPINTMGTTTRDECKRFTNGAGVWVTPPCSFWDETPSVDPDINETDYSETVVPCCTDHKSTCQMMSTEHCKFIDGEIPRKKEKHCAQVLCLKSICTIGNSLFQVEPDEYRPWLASETNKIQWYRALFSLSHTMGVVHIVPLLALELLLLKPLEMSVGWFRMAATYLASSVAGQLVHAIIQPAVPTEGSTCGLAGIIGEAVVELSQAWNVLSDPSAELQKLIVWLVLLLFMGFFPWVSFFGTITGFICGTISALIFMPYLTFDRWSRIRNNLMILGGCILMIWLYLSIIYIFHGVQPAPCKICRDIECISFASDMCKNLDLLG